MAGTTAKTGLNYDHFKVAYDRNSYDGLSAVYREKVSGLIRTPKHHPVIQQIFEHFSQLEG